MILRLLSILVLAAASTALRLLPFRVVRALFRGRARGDSARVIRAVDSAARLVPGSTCLARALAARALGAPGRVVLGVSRERGFAAHAWLEGSGGGRGFEAVAALEG